MHDFWLCFVPLFVAVDAIGVLPLFISLTEDIEPARMRQVVGQSVLTAAGVAAAFLLIGPAVLDWMGIAVTDFMIAGGAMLFVIALSDLLRGEKSQRQVDPSTIGAVPIGVPLITGPAVLTACLLLMNQYGHVPTLAAVLLNILIAGSVFLFSKPITRFLGSAGTRTLSKIASLLLASVAVMMVRKGVTGLVVTLP